MFERAQITEKQALAIKNKAERTFALAAIAAGYWVCEAPAIRSPHPVIDRFGKPRKVVTHPDFLLVDPLTERTMHIEITAGDCLKPSKLAQLRVAQAAGVNNYIQIGREGLECIFSVDVPEEKRDAIGKIVGWD